MGILSCTLSVELKWQKQGHVMSCYSAKTLPSLIDDISLHIIQKQLSGISMWTPFEDNSFVAQPPRGWEEQKACRSNVFLRGDIHVSSGGQKPNLIFFLTAFQTERLSKSRITYVSALAKYQWFISCYPIIWKCLPYQAKKTIKSNFLVHLNWISSCG